MCDVSYIPERLHSKQRPKIPDFNEGELIFRRCKNPSDPYDEISLYDLSHNRQGQPDQPLCIPEDVLWNMTPDKRQGERILDQLVITLCIIAICKEIGTYIKTFAESGEDGTCYKVSMILRHSPECCNFAHCVFEVIYNDELVTRENYKKTLGKSNRIGAKLRTLCKYELSDMMLTHNIVSDLKIHT